MPQQGITTSLAQMQDEAMWAAWEKSRKGGKKETTTQLRSPWKRGAAEAEEEPESPWARPTQAAVSAMPSPQEPRRYGRPVLRRDGIGVSAAPGPEPIEAPPVEGEPSDIEKAIEAALRGEQAGAISPGLLGEMPRSDIYTMIDAGYGLRQIEQFSPEDRRFILNYIRQREEEMMGEGLPTHPVYRRVEEQVREYQARQR